MFLTGFDTADSFAQLVTVLIVFVLVLALTLYTTRWIARYQKGQKKGGNIEVVETCPMGNGKYVQILRLADTYVAVAVCKDTVTFLTELPREQLVLSEGEIGGSRHFMEFLKNAKSMYRSKEEKNEEPPKEE